MNKTIPAALAALSALAGPAFAQDDFTLDPIVISGGLVPVEAAKLGRASTVMTEQDIADSGDTYAVDLLRALPGLSVSRTGPAGGLTQVRMRGHEANHTLVLIDGVEVASPSQGEYDFSGLLSSDIERIEVLRGPQSSLYGSSAIGGVISITTKRATEPGFSGEAGFEISSDQSTQYSLALRQRTDKLSLSFSATRRDTVGYDVAGQGGEKDEDINQTYNLTARYQASDTVAIGGTLRHVKSDSEFDASNPAATGPMSQILISDLSGSDVAETFGSVFAEIETLGGQMLNRIDLSYADVQTDRRGGTGAQSGDTSETRMKISYKGSLALDGGTIANANHLLTVAAEWERETFVNNNAAFVFAPSQLVKRTREQASLVAEYQGNLTDDLSVQASLRHDFNDQFKDFTTYSLGLSYIMPNQTTRLHASYGTGVQNPTLFEQFGFANNFVGNPNLVPEQSKGWDIGIEQQFANGRGLIDVTYFDDVLTNEIGSTVVGGNTTPVNQAGTSDRRGIEVAASWQITDQLDVGLNYTWLDSTSPNGSTEIRRAEHEASFQLGYSFPDDQTRFNMEIRHVSGNMDTFFLPVPPYTSTNVTLPDYTLVNVGLTHQLTDNVQLYSRVTNLTDQDYQEVLGYHTEGRVMHFGLNTRF